MKRADDPSAVLAGIASTGKLTSMAEKADDAGGSLISLAVEGRCATITLARPKLNPANDNLLHQLDSALSEIERHSDLAVIRIRNDQAAFSAGADLEMVKSRIGSDEGARAMMETAHRFQRVYNRLALQKAVTIAEIEGHALGGGLELALACDLRIASRRAKLGLPEARMGLLPGAGGTQRLTQLCGPGIAARLILTCELVDGAEAERLGIVQWSYEPEDFPAAADAFAASVEGLSVPALHRAKECIGLAVTPKRARLTGGSGGHRRFDENARGGRAHLQTFASVSRKWSRRGHVEKTSHGGVESRLNLNAGSTTRRPAELGK